MKASLINLARFNPSISTQHYLYFNEAVSAITSCGLAADTVQSLSFLPNHQKIVNQCGFPTRWKPEYFLIRLAQSTTYHKALCKNAEITNSILTVLKNISEIDYPPALETTLNPSEQMAFYEPMTEGLHRALNQIECAQNISTQHMRLSRADDANQKLVDSLVPELHWLTSGLMVFDSIRKEQGRGRACDDEMSWWLNLTLECTLRKTAQSMGSMLDEIGPAHITARDRWHLSPQTLRFDKRYFGSTLKGIDYGLGLLVGSLKERTDYLAVLRDFVVVMRNIWSQPLIRHCLSENE